MPPTSADPDGVDRPSVTATDQDAGSSTTSRETPSTTNDLTDDDWEEVYHAHIIEVLPYDPADTDWEVVDARPEGANRTRTPGTPWYTVFDTGDERGALTLLDHENGLGAITLMTAMNRREMIDCGFRISGMLEKAGIRHCLVGDLAAKVLDAWMVINTTCVVVADEQLDEAYAVIEEGDFLQQTSTYFFGPVCTADEVDIPGRAYCDHGYNRPGRVVIIAAGFLHLDLGQEHYHDHTFWVNKFHCRLPELVNYVDSVISALACRTARGEEFNGTLSRYLDYNIHCMLKYAPDKLRGLLPVEARFYLDLIRHMFVPQAKVRMCEEYVKIRAGTSTVEESMKRVPKRGLKLLAFKTLREARKKAKMEAEEKAKREAEKAEQENDNEAAMQEKHEAK